MEDLQSYLNLFSLGINLEEVFNIATGKTASLETKELLFNARKTEEEQREFIDKVVDNPECFQTRCQEGGDLLG